MMDHQNPFEPCGAASVHASEESVPDLVVKFNRNTIASACALCGNEMPLRVGPILVVERTGQPICPEHVVNFAGDARYEEFAMFEAARDWYPVYMPPPSTRFTTLREAIFRHPTAIYSQTGRDYGTSGVGMLAEQRDQLDVPVVWIDDKLYRAQDKRAEDQEPLSEVDIAWSAGNSLAETLERAALRGSTWMTMDGLLWTSEQLLHMLTTAQLAVHVTWGTVCRDSMHEGPCYEGLVPFNRQGQHPEDIPLLIEMRPETDASLAIRAVSDPRYPIPCTRLATETDRPFWPLDRKDA